MDKSTPTSQVYYEGDLRTTAVHLRSDERIITDAPVDNQGRGAAFSPTDLCATSLATCMLTIIGIRANEAGLEMKGAKATVTKKMAAHPRRIAAIEITIEIPGISWPESVMHQMEKAARECPVALSLHPDIVQVVSFTYR